MNLNRRLPRQFLFGFVLSCLLFSSAIATTCTEPTNVALAANGATATASSTYAGFAASGVINGDRKGLHAWQNGFWSTATAGFPAWLEVQFNGSKTISEIDIITVQNNYNAPVEPTAALTFSSFGLSSYQVQYWTGTAWATISGGSVTGNNKVWRKFTFAPLTTTKIRVLASAAPDNFSRLAEVEAWTGPSPAPRHNLALGAAATASSSWTGWPASSAVNGDRTSLNAGTDGGWVDAAPAHSFPDWLQIDFGTSRTIDEIHVFTLQNNYTGSVEPTESMTFTKWGLTGYEVQYWNGSGWITVPGGSVSGNNKIWRKFTFSSISTSKIRVLTNASVDGYSRITEVEAYAPQASVCASIARLDPLNATGGGGENPLSQNFNWNLPLVSLPGRAGMDLGLSLSYNSLVWTKNDTYISFDEDNGFPGPGFHLGFPVIQPLHYNHETGKHAFLLLGPDGSRTELRQVSTAAPNNLLFEAADSSHLLLDAGNMTLFTTDGTQLTYELQGNQFNCRQIKDRNGNYITIEYVAGRLDKVIDTVGRQIRFNYDGIGLLTSITQLWKQGANQVEHQWARFAYTDTAIQTNFANLPVSGPTNNTNIKTLSRVTLADDSRYEFSYTSWGQVWKISSFAADNSQLNYRAYNLPGSPLLASSPQVDCPRFTERRDWVKYWNGDVEGAPAAIEEAVTAYSGPVSDTWIMPAESQPVSGKRTQVTLPDGTVNRIYFVEMAGAPRWRRGLPALVETSSGGTWQRKVKTAWTQDDESVNYPLNPRVLETLVYDPAGNQASSRIAYLRFTFANGTSCWLPRDVFEYAADGDTILRTARTSYNTSASYTDRRILGLVSEKLLYEGDANAINPPLLSKVQFVYDEVGSLQSTAAPAVQHANPNFVAGRANLTSVKRYNVNNLTEFTATSSKYNTTGAVISTKDASNHEVLISYADSFSDNISRNTFAYPTTVIDPDGHSSTTKYNFDFGAVTSRRTPAPNVNTPGPEQAYVFDNLGRLQQVTNLVNNAYTRFIYAADALRVDTYTTIEEGQGEAHSFRIADGGGRVIATATDHPGSAGGFSGQRIIYDVMGRVFRASNPTETSASGHPFHWNTAGDDAAAGWLYTQQTYDWKGRPLRTTHPDATYREATYSGCGCAGGEVVTLTDEGTIDGGVSKHRQEKIYSDVLGRMVKTEILNWSGGSVYASTVNSYDVRDQLTDVRQYAGPAGSSTFQTTTMTYDGYGRLKTRHVPEQNAGAATTYAYNDDDTLLSVTDARGAVTSYTRNGRRLVTGISYSVPPGSGIPAPAPVSYSYDPAGNRSEMLDGLGAVTYTYDSLSRLTSETRSIAQASPATYTIGYQYNLAGQLSSITDPNNNTINYTRDATGRITAITGASFAGVTAYVSNMRYRAWGAIDQLAYGNGKTLNTTYNARLKAESFQIPGLISKSYDYYADGTLRFSSDLMDHRFDRLYRWDHAGRLKEALSGAEARGEGPSTDRPYKQSFAYDPMGHLTQRTKHWWNLNPASTSGSYTNNRHDPVGQLWQYDAGGNLLMMPGAGYTYDASGRVSAMSSSGSAALAWDGDGRKTKSTEVVFNAQTDTDITTTSYFIYSTVLGRVLTELVHSDDPDITVPGFFSRTFVHGDSGVLAHQISFGPGPGAGEVWWEYRDPSNASYRTATNTSTPGAQQELDPTGADQGLSAPVSQGIPDEGLLAPYPRSSNPSQPFAAYSIDGVRVPLDEFIEQVHFQFHGELGLNEAAAVASRNRGGRQGFFPSVNEEEPLLGSSSMWLFGFRPGGPQHQATTRLTEDEIKTLSEDLTKLLSNPECANFLQSVLKQLKDDTQRSNYDSADALTLFEKVQSGRGFDWNPALNGQARASGGHDHIGKNIASMSIKPVDHFRNLSDSSHSGQRGRTIIHELFHVAGYDHQAMALAAYTVGGRFDDSWRAWKGDFPDPQDPLFRRTEGQALLNGAYSGFFKNVLEQKCR